MTIPKIVVQMPNIRRHTFKCEMKIKIFKGAATVALREEQTTWNYFQPNYDDYMNGACQKFDDIKCETLTNLFKILKNRTAVRQQDDARAATSVCMCFDSGGIGCCEWNWTHFDWMFNENECERKSLIHCVFLFFFFQLEKTYKKSAKFGRVEPSTIW